MLGCWIQLHLVVHLTLPYDSCERDNHTLVDYTRKWLKKTKNFRDSNLCVYLLLFVENCSN